MNNTLSDKEIVEMCYIVISCTNMLDKRYKHKYDKDVSDECNKWCREHSINITHGSAYKELRHKTYYYINKNIQSIIKCGFDKYGLYKNKVVSDKQIVHKLLNKEGN